MEIQDQKKTWVPRKMQRRLRVSPTQKEQNGWKYPNDISEQPKIASQSPALSRATGTQQNVSLEPEHNTEVESHAKIEA